MPAEPTWRIRPFALEDYEAVLALWEDAGDGVRVGVSDTRAEVAKKLARDPELFLVAESAGELIGVLMGAWDGRRGYLHHLAIARPWRRLGVATALVAVVEEGLRARGCLKVHLLVAAQNAAALGLYGRLGYEALDTYITMSKTL